MINNKWYALLASKEVPKKGMVGVKRLGEKLALWRIGKDKIVCIQDKCCHRGASISAGKLIGDQAECPFHGFRYDESGKVDLIPANGKSQEVADRFRVHSFPAQEKYGFIWVWRGDKTEDLPEIPFFDDLKQGFFYSQVTDHWNTHYTRCIENQMDVVHVPFVHHNTIGRGGKTIVHGPKIKWDGDQLTWYVKNVKDTGSNQAIKAADMGDTRDLFSLQIIMPNIWHNIISQKLRVFAAFAPIDETNTMIYLRFYQSFMPLWGLRHFIGWIGGIYSKIILRQDKRVVAKQLPKKSSLKMGEKLIPGDRPIAEFRRRYEELSDK